MGQSKGTEGSSIHYPQDVFSRQEAHCSSSESTVGDVAEGPEDSIGHAFDLAVQVGLPSSATGEGRLTVVLRFASFRRIVELSDHDGGLVGR